MICIPLWFFWYGNIDIQSFNIKHIPSNIEIKIKDFKTDNLVNKFYKEVMYKGIDGLYFSDIKLILLLTPVNSSNYVRGETIYHEYLHYKYMELEIKNKEREELLNLVMEDKYEREMLLLQTRLEDNDLNIGLTEYISHKYDGYVYGCKQKKDKITNKIIELGILEPSIYCNKNK